MSHSDSISSSIVTEAKGTEEKSSNKVATIDSSNPWPNQTFKPSVILEQNKQTTTTKPPIVLSTIPNQKDNGNLFPWPIPFDDIWPYLTQTEQNLIKEYDDLKIKIIPLINFDFEAILIKILLDQKKLHFNHLVEQIQSLYYVRPSDILPDFKNFKEYLRLRPNLFIKKNRGKRCTYALNEPPRIPIISNEKQINNLIIDMKNMEKNKFSIDIIEFLKYRNKLTTPKQKNHNKINNNKKGHMAIHDIPTFYRNKVLKIDGMYNLSIHPHKLRSLYFYSKESYLQKKIPIPLITKILELKSKSILCPFTLVDICQYIVDRHEAFVAPSVLIDLFPNIPRITSQQQNQTSQSLKQQKKNRKRKRGC